MSGYRKERRRLPGQVQSTLPQAALAGAGGVNRAHSIPVVTEPPPPDYHASNNFMSKQQIIRTTITAIFLLIIAFLLVDCSQQAPSAEPTKAAPTLAPTIAIASPTPAPTKASTATANEKKAAEEADKSDKEYPEAYDFTAKNLLTNETFSLSDYRGKIVFLNFWGSWCPPCRMEMPGFQKIYEKYSDDVVIIGVGINDSPGSLIEFANSIGVTYPITNDRTSEIARHYRIRNLPTTYRIDQEGKIRGVAVGALSEEQLVKAIEELLARK